MSVTYSGSFMKFVIKGSYDNVSGMSRLTDYAISGCFSGESLYYNGNNLVGFCQKGSYTDTFYLKFSKFLGTAASWGVGTQTQGSIEIKSNVAITSATIIDPSSALYQTITAANYYPVPNNGLFSANRTDFNKGFWNSIFPKDANSYDLGSTSGYWRKSYTNEIYGLIDGSWNKINRKATYSDLGLVKLGSNTV